ncbi:ABC transporter substrate-binding protein [Frankia sp. AgB32]|uniref:ABC transporter substrate-binding protein n=1 Tax=Frankia sp. AgB32 TaxID=631119 RepID=UPI00200F4EB6|nr:ABC transporter substrate-binding protein [Frankia sp. AgB32]MCK9897845.1 ABC transporter substrate-binding protein [Frankia sp. AgB32]
MPIASRCRRRFSAAVVTATAVAVTAAACSSSGTTASSNGPGADTVVVAWPSDVTSVDVANQIVDQDKELAMNTYQTLVGYHFAKNAAGVNTWQGTTSDPQLAESWTFSGPSITFHLRRGIKFYPSGNPMTADDVKFSLDRALEHNGSIEMNNSGIFDAKQIVVVDPNTVRIDYTDSAGTPVTAGTINLATLRMPFYGIEDKKEVLAHATSADPEGTKWIETHVAGTGPYYLANRTPGQQIELKAVPGLWSGEPEFKNVTIRVINNSNVPSLLTGGAVNVALYGISPKDAQDLAANFTVSHAGTPDFQYIQMAEDVGPLKDKLVRQAIANAVPYDKILSDVYYGKVGRSYSYVNPQAAGYTKAWEHYGSMDTAKALMRQAGSPTFTVPLRYSSQDSTFESIARLLKDSLGQLGITVQLTPMTSSALFQYIQDRASGTVGTDNDGIVLTNLSVYLDDPKGPVNFWTGTKGGLNFQRFSNPTVDAALKDNALAPPGPKRDAAFAAVQTLVADDASYVPIVQTGRTVVTAKSVTNVTFQPEIGLRYWMFTHSG